MKKAKEQEFRFRKIEGFLKVERDDLTKRAVIKCKMDDADEATSMAGSVCKKRKIDEN